MSAVADLINKLLRQRSVYIQGLDLRAKISGVGFSQIPHIHSRNHTHMYSECDERSFCSMTWWAPMYSVLFGIFSFLLSIQSIKIPNKTDKPTNFHMSQFILTCYWKNVTNVLWFEDWPWCDAVFFCTLITVSFLLSFLFDVSMKTTNRRIVKNLTF